MISKNIVALLLIAISCSTLHATDSTSERTVAQAADAESKTQLAAGAAGTPWLYWSKRSGFCEEVRAYIKIQKKPDGKMQLLPFQLLQQCEGPLATQKDRGFAADEHGKIRQLTEPEIKAFKESLDSGYEDLYSEGLVKSIEVQDKALWSIDTTISERRAKQVFAGTDVQISLRAAQDKDELLKLLAQIVGSEHEIQQ